jgi:hypothetical protein
MTKELFMLLPTEEQESFINSGGTFEQVDEKPV